MASRSPALSKTPTGTTKSANAVSRKYKKLRARPSPLNDCVRQRLLLKLNAENDFRETPRTRDPSAPVVNEGITEC